MYAHYELHIVRNTWKIEYNMHDIKMTADYNVVVFTLNVCETMIKVTTNLYSKFDGSSKRDGL